MAPLTSVREVKKLSSDERKICVPAFVRASIILLTTAMTRSGPAAPLGSGGVKRLQLVPDVCSVQLSSKFTLLKLIPVVLIAASCVIGDDTEAELVLAVNGIALDPCEGFTSSFV